MKIAVVLPTYNEADNIAAMTTALLALPLDLRLFIVDDNSPDGTGALADQLAAEHPRRVEVLHRPKKDGLGRAYKAGFARALAADADAIVQMDCDFSHSPTYLPAMVEALSAWANVYARAILRLKVRDATAGFKVWRREVLEAIDTERVISNGYIFQVEMAYLTQKLGFSHHELPIYFEDRRIGHSKMDVPVKVEAAYRVLELLWKHRGISRAATNPPAVQTPFSQ